MKAAFDRAGDFRRLITAAATIMMMLNDDTRRGADGADVSMRGRRYYVC